MWVFNDSRTDEGDMEYEYLLNGIMNCLTENDICRRINEESYKNIIVDLPYIGRKSVGEIVLSYVKQNGGYNNLLFLVSKGIEEEVLGIIRHLSQNAKQETYICYGKVKISKT